MNISNKKKSIFKILKQKFGGAYVSTTVKVVLAVVLGLAILSSVFVVSTTSLNTANARIAGMYNYSQSGGSGGTGGSGGAVVPGTPIMLDGANQVYNKASASPLTFRSSAPIDTFQSVKVDGNVVDSSNYTVTEGSTIITFNESYSKQLAEGDHTIDIVSTTGTASTTFKAELPAGLYDANGNMTMTWDEIKNTYPDAFTTNGHITGCPPEDGPPSSAFADISGKLVIKNDITDINDWGFYGCASLTDIIISDTVKNIGESAFEDCVSLKNVTIPNSVTNINRTAFMGCTSLSSIKIPNSVTSVGDSVFNNCSLLTNVTLGTGLTNINCGIFTNCISLTNIIIPDNVTNINDNAFEGCTSLSNITIPKSVTNIGFLAFNGCTSLTGINYNGSKSEWNTISIEEYAFCDTPSITVHCTDGDLTINS